MLSGSASIAGVEIGEGLVVFLLEPPEDAAIAQGDGVARLQLQGRRVIGDRGGSLRLQAVSVSAVDVEWDVVRLEPEGRRVVGGPRRRTHPADGTRRRGACRPVHGWG